MWTLLPCLIYYYFEDTPTQLLDPQILTKSNILQRGGLKVVII